MMLPDNKGAPGKSMLHPVARHTVRYSYVIFGILLIILAVCTLAVRLGLPLIASYKSGIEARVSTYLKSPVDIGELSLKWEGFGPLLRAEDVAVLESDERKVTLDELLIDINLAKSLLRGVPVINELTLVGVNLAVEADASGQLSIHGMEQVVTSNRPVDEGKSSEQLPASDGIDLMSWLFNASKVGLLDSTLTLIDLKTDNRLVVEDVNIRAENRGAFHQLRVEVSLPESLGGKVVAGIDLTGNSRQLGDSNGSIYLKAEKLQVGALSKSLSLSGLMGHLPDAPLPVDANVSVEMWGGWDEGQLTSLRGPVTATSIMNADTGAAVLDKLSADLSISSEQAAYSLVAEDVRAELSDLQLDIRQLRAGWSTNDEQAYTFAIDGDVLPLEFASRLIGAVSAASVESFDATLAQLSPTGSLIDWSFDLESGAGALLLNAAADIRALDFRPVGSMPGMGPLDGRLELVDSKGILSVAGNQMALSWPAVSETDVMVDVVTADINLDLSNQQRLLASGVMDLLDDGIETSTRFKTTIYQDQSPHLDIQSGYEVADITAIKQWIPHKLLPAEINEWLENSIRGGVASDGSLLFFGRIDDFPFAEGEGVLRASVDLEDGELEFLPDWPLVSDINATIDLNGLALSSRAKSARMNTFNITSADLRIDNLAAPVLDMKGTGNGLLQSALQFANEGPLGVYLEPVLYDVTGDGDVEMDIAVTYPFFSKPPDIKTRVGDKPRRSSLVVAQANLWQAFNVDGSLFLNNNDVSSERAGFTLEGVSGAVGFDQDGIDINNLRATLLGHQVLVNADTKGVGLSAITNLSLVGALEINDVLAHQGNTLDQFVQGSSQWNIDLTAPHSEALINRDGVKMKITSDLVGTELVLPSPMYKSSARATPFSLTTSFKNPEDEQRWEILYGDNVHALASTTNNILDSLLVHIGPDAPDVSVIAPGPEGIRLQGKLDTMAMDGWVQIVSRYIDSLTDDTVDPEPILPISADLTVESLVLGSQSMGRTTLRSNTDASYLNAVVANQSFSGSFRYPRQYWDKQTPLRARIQQMDWAVIDALSSDSLDPDAIDTGELDPRLLPPIEARINRLTRGNLAVRDLIVRAQPDVSGINISTFGFAYDTMRLVGQGHWHLRDPQSVNSGLDGKHYTQLNLVLQSDDFGVGLTEVGLKDILLDGQGSVELKLNWPGPAYKPEFERLDGSVKLLIEGGSIIPLEPGVGRVVGLFAFQALPRRLNLDFKDLTADGLAFKQIKGDATIDNGIANVSLVQLTGPIGVVDITGSSDLVNEQFDQRVTVLPRVSAALPIIGAIAGGASAGIGALLATGFLKAIGMDFDRIGLRNYKLTGDWDEPQFEPLSAEDIRGR